MRHKLRDIRILTAVCFIGLGLAVGAVVLVTGGPPTRHTITIAMTLLGLIAAAWFFIDRGLIHHIHNHRLLPEQPERPEFYDFDLLNQPMHSEEFDGKMLRGLSFVVFDTETTGLKPSAGDEILSIAGVRIRDGRIDREDVFDRLVNPGRSIPRASIRFHGITEAMVRDQPLASDVLGHFRGYVGDSILIAHNAAFDMAFLRRKEAEAGVRFDHVVLDTLLLSVFLHNETGQHTLDAIAQRFGVPIEGRHTALGDSLVTAGVFLGMLEMLEARGITSLHQALKATNKMIHVRKLQAKF